MNLIPLFLLWAFTQQGGHAKAPPWPGPKSPPPRAPAPKAAPRVTQKPAAKKGLAQQAMKKVPHPSLPGKHLHIP